MAGGPIPSGDHFDVAESGQWQVVAQAVPSIFIYPRSRCLGLPSQVHCLGANQHWRVPQRAEIRLSDSPITSCEGSCVRREEHRPPVLLPMLIRLLGEEPHEQKVNGNVTVAAKFGRKG